MTLRGERETMKRNGGKARIEFFILFWWQMVPKKRDHSRFYALVLAASSMLPEETLLM